jgi:hypothetical protein
MREGEKEKKERTDLAGEINKKKKKKKKNQKKTREKKNEKNSYVLSVNER